MRLRLRGGTQTARWRTTVPVFSAGALALLLAGGSAVRGRSRYPPAGVVSSETGVCGGGVREGSPAFSEATLLLCRAAAGSESTAAVSFPP